MLKSKALENIEDVRSIECVGVQSFVLISNGLETVFHDDKINQLRQYINQQAEAFS